MKYPQWLIGTALVAVLLLAGCGSEPEAQVLPTNLPTFTPAPASDFTLMPTSTPSALAALAPSGTQVNLDESSPVEEPVAEETEVEEPVTEEAEAEEPVAEETEVEEPVAEETEVEEPVAEETEVEEPVAEEAEAEEPVAEETEVEEPVAEEAEAEEPVAEETEVEEPVAEEAEAEEPVAEEAEAEEPVAEEAEVEEPVAEKAEVEEPVAEEAEAEEPVAEEAEAEEPVAEEAEVVDPALAGLPEEFATLLAAADAANGETLALQYACIGCHNVNPELQMAGPTWYNVAETAATRVEGESAALYLYNSIVNPNDYVVDGYVAGIMLQNFADTVSPEDLADLVAYLLTLEGME